MTSLYVAPLILLQLLSTSLIPLTCKQDGDNPIRDELLDFDDIGTAALRRCDVNCAARQIHISHEARVPGKKEWSVGGAVCAICGRVAGRGVCLSNVERS
jgi:hypothetical protein